jgi:hypothetical protein
MQVECPECKGNATQIPFYSESGKKVQCPHCDTKLIVVSNNEIAGLKTLIFVVIIMLLHSSKMLNDKLYLVILSFFFMFSLFMLGQTKFIAIVSEDNFYNKRNSQLTYSLNVLFILSFFIPFYVKEWYPYFSSSISLHLFLTSQLNWMIFVSMLYMLKIVKNKYITIAFILVCIKMLIIITPLLRMLFFQIDLDIITEVIIQQGLFLIDLFLIPLVLFAFKSLSDDLKYQKNLNIILVLFILQNFILKLMFNYFSEFVMTYKVFLFNILFLLYFGVIYYFIETVLNMLDRKKALEDAN